MESKSEIDQMIQQASRLPQARGDWELSEDVARAWGSRRGSILRLPPKRHKNLAGMVCIKRQGTVACMATSGAAHCAEAALLDFLRI